MPKSEEQKFVPLVKKPPKEAKMEPGEKVPRQRTKGWKGRITSGRDVDLEGLVTKQDLREARNEDIERINGMSADELRQALRNMHEDPGKMKLAGLRKKMKKIVLDISKETSEAYERRSKPLATEKGAGLVRYRKPNGDVVFVTKKQKLAWVAKRVGAKRGGKERVATVDYVTSDGRTIQRSPAQVAFLEAQKARKGTGAGRKPRNGKAIPVGEGDLAAYNYWLTLGPKQRVPWAHFYGSTYTNKSKTAKDPGSRAKFAAKKRREFIKKRDYGEGLKVKQPRKKRKEKVE